MFARRFHLVRPHSFHPRCSSLRAGAFARIGQRESVIASQKDALATTHHGKGTTSVVPSRSGLITALAAGGQLSKRNPGNAEQYLYSAGRWTKPRLTGF